MFGFIRIVLLLLLLSIHILTYSKEQIIRN
jgi:hypothetical protein